MGLKLFSAIAKLAIIYLVALLLSGRTVRADTLGETPSSTKADQIWLQIFGTSPTAIDDNIFLRLLDPNGSCELARHVSRNITTYRKLLSSDQTTPNQAEAMATNLKSEAQRLLYQQPSACRDTALMVYATESVALLTQFHSKHQGTLKVESSDLSVTRSLAFFTAAALRLKVVAFKTPSNLESGPNGILGTYICHDTKVGIDPAQEPLNLAATIVHEFSHLFLDKLSWLNSDEIASQKLQAADFSKFILIEESFAALYAGFLQRTFAKQRLSKALRGRQFSDLTFYSTSGPLTQISELVELQNGHESAAFSAVGIATFFGSKNWNLDFKPANFTATEIIPGGAQMLQLIRQFDAELALSRNRLYEKLSKTYFQQTLSSSQLELFGPDQVASILSFHTIQNPVTFAVGFDSIMAPQNMLAGDVRIIHGSARSESPYDGLVAGLAVPTRLLRLLKDPYFLEVSRLCNQYETSVRAGELDGYLGTKLKGQSSAFQRPSEKGIRPSEKGVRPCIHIGDGI